MRWTEKEFDRTVEHSRLGEKMVAACRDVLTLGMTGVEAAQKHSVLPPHISRGLKALREKREELRAHDIENANALKAMDAVTDISSLLKAAAREAAQSIKGSGWIIRDSEPGQVYQGAGVVKAGGFFVQDIGRVGVVHDLKNLEIEPVLGKSLEITYPNEGKGTVKDVPLERGRRETER